MKQLTEIMKNNEEILALLRKHAEGRCSQEEDRFIRNWLYENIAGSEYDCLFEDLLETSMPENDAKEKAAASYRRLEERIAGIQGQQEKKKKKNSWLRRGLIISLAAASIAAAFFLLSYLPDAPSFDIPALTADSTLRTFHVPAGSNADFRLPDGTVIKMNSATTVKYPEKFSGPERRIYIDGEAYLDVAHNPERPFVVETDHFEVKVHGTEFNVNTYGTESDPFVVLAKGSVEVSDGNASCFIEPGMMALYSQKGIAVKNVNVEEYICWKDRYIILNGMDIRTISTRLALYYGIEVSFEGLDKQLYGKLDLTDDIMKVFENISMIAPVNVIRKDTGYQLTAK